MLHIVMNIHIITQIIHLQIWQDKSALKDLVSNYIGSIGQLLGMHSLGARLVTYVAISIIYANLFGSYSTLKEQLTNREFKIFSALTVWMRRHGGRGANIGTAVFLGRASDSRSEFSEILHSFPVTFEHSAQKREGFGSGY